MELLHKERVESPKFCLTVGVKLRLKNDILIFSRTGLE